MSGSSQLPGSSWADYDPALISPGGGVFPRTAKSIPLSPEARAALGIEAEALTPNELIRALLRAPVDLLWNGGIGTYVKAKRGAARRGRRPGERRRPRRRRGAALPRRRRGREPRPHAARAASRTRCGGGRIYMDAIDNSAGVDCSDHEVNIKILLDAIVADGELTAKQRNALLAEMTDEVADARAARQLRADAGDRDLGGAGGVDGRGARALHPQPRAGRPLDRELEVLPDDEALTSARPRAAG